MTVLLFYWAENMWGVLLTVVPTKEEQQEEEGLSYHRNGAF
jgi:hypothetical protein